MTTNEGQTYCLRWNNHKSNLVEILDALIKMESYVDCTIVVDDQVQFKAHRVVLAANSPYFQSILQDVPMDHCSILFPGVQAFEMRALLEYMYTGEVNVTQSQIPKIMKIAEQLEVKGLFDMTDLREKFNKYEDPMAHYSPAAYQNNNNTSTSNNNTNNSGNSNSTSNVNNNDQEKISDVQQSSPITSTSATVTATAAQSSSSSPPYTYKSPYASIYSKSPGPSTSDRHPPWPMSPHLTNPMPSAAAAAMLGSVYESAPDMNPLKRKKISSISSMLMSRDTPILRNVLAQSSTPDSSQPMPLICQPVKQERSHEKSSPGSCNGSSEYNNSERKHKYDEPHSPYTDKSFDEEPMDMKPGYLNDSRIASYVPQQQQKPEWKRYKQYTRSDILSAIECVRNGMSALQASRKFGVPSRTLYDKVKKLGITTGRPMNRTMKRSPSSGSSPSGFPYNLSGASHHYGPSEHMLQMHEAAEREKERDHTLTPTIPHPAAALLDPSFLQQAFESRGGDIAGREALHAMALAAAAHAAVNGISTSPGTNGTARSPSPNLSMKYMRQPSPPERAQEQETLEEDEDRVEDLSIGRKETHSPPLTPSQPSHPLHMSHYPETGIHHQPQPQPQTGVIVPPITKLPTNDDYHSQMRHETTTTTSEDPRD